jgi:EAL domain-containing protein (putative c-di-GMP-specific phosphodiesterase class I)
LTRAIVAFAADVDATVLAEGVEEAAELEFLGEAGVTLAQGFYLGRPATPDRYLSVST